MPKMIGKNSPRAPIECKGFLTVILILSLLDQAEHLDYMKRNPGRLQGTRPDWSARRGKQGSAAAEVQCEKQVEPLSPDSDMDGPSAA